MAIETRSEVPVLPVADPAPLGLAAFALTTFLLSVRNANLGSAQGLQYIGLAFFYGGLAQFLAGMWEFRNRNTFGATAFSTYGAFWLSLAFYAFFLAPNSKTVADDLAWFLLAFAIFNTYMWLWSSRVSVAVFMVFLTLEATEILLFIGLFLAGGGHSNGANIIKIGGWVGVATAACAWYASAAGVVNGMAGRKVIPVGAPIWGAPAPVGRPGGPLPRMETRPAQP